MTILKITILVLIASNVFALVWLTKIKIAMGYMIKDITNLEECITNLNKSVRVVTEMVKKYLAVEIAEREKENEDSMA
jgi:hypothetical protein